MNMLQIVRAATGEMGLTVPTVVAGSTSPDTIQQLALLNAVGRQLMREYDWQGLVKQNIITVTYTTITGDTTSGSSTITNIADTTGLSSSYAITGTGINQGTYISAVPSSTTLTLTQPATATGTGITFTLGKVKYDFPSDYDRQIDRTHWDKSKHWEMLGPETPQQWEWLISGYISTGPRTRYRILGNQHVIWPIVTTAEVLGFEYVSKNWASTSTGTAKASFTVDTDTCQFPDELMIVGLKRKYFEVKGFDSSSFEADWSRQLNISKANDAGSLTLSMEPRISNVLINWNQIPDSNYGS